MSSDFHVYTGVVNTDLEVGFCPFPVVPSYRVLTFRPEGDMLRSEHVRRSTKVARQWQSPTIHRMERKLRKTHVAGEIRSFLCPQTS
jgi:hypothetical protein